MSQAGEVVERVARRQAHSKARESIWKVTRWKRERRGSLSLSLSIVDGGRDYSSGTLQSAGGGGIVRRIGRRSLSVTYSLGGGAAPDALFSLADVFCHHIRKCLFRFRRAHVRRPTSENTRRLSLSLALSREGEVRACRLSTCDAAWIEFSSGSWKKALNSHGCDFRADLSGWRAPRVATLSFSRCEVLRNHNGQSKGFGLATFVDSATAARSQSPNAARRNTRDKPTYEPRERDERMRRRRKPPFPAVPSGPLYSSFL